MEIVKLKANIVIDDFELSDLSEQDLEEVDLEVADIEFIIKEVELGEIETDKRLAKNVIKTTKMLVELTDENTIYITNEILRRPNFEINGGIKSAEKKGARVREAKIFNLFFRFKNRKFDGINTTALMVRPIGTDEEWVILLPEDTSQTIIEEKKTFQQYFQKLFVKGLLDTDFQNTVVDGYKLLNPNERCAQTLMHEYGHILQWRMYDHLDIMGETEEEFIRNQYIWFLKSTYLYNISARIPNFETLDVKDKVYYLKECLVEDYRIYLNNRYFNGRIVLPNKYAYRGDFANSTLMWEGLSIMERMLRPAIEGEVSKRQLKKVSSDAELSLQAVNHRLDILEGKNEWVPGTSRLTAEHIYNDLKQLGVKVEKRVLSTV
ncbi:MULTISPECIES: hypothetical protein [Priestia]|uniref:hypothetical protein n=1 Tax=Priestia TaxID=2800373 RepID=UPI000BFC33F0|nr:hypothetical protein [Priestia aryabhattai]PHF65983.1 hypothetical protein COI42_23115 [Priestia aryabhattai]